MGGPKTFVGTSPQLEGPGSDIAASLGAAAALGRHVPGRRCRRAARDCLTATTEDRPTLHHLMAAVGFLLLHWSSLEQRLDGQPVPSELDGVRRLRNALCHGLVSATAGGASTGAHVCCLMPSGERTTYTLEEISHAIRTLEAFNGRRLIPLIASSRRPNCAESPGGGHRRSKRRWATNPQPG